MRRSAIVTGASASFLIVSVSADGLDGSQVPDGASSREACSRVTYLSQLVLVLGELVEYSDIAFATSALSRCNNTRLSSTGVELVSGDSSKASKSSSSSGERPRFPPRGGFGVGSVVGVGFGVGLVVGVGFGVGFGDFTSFNSRSWIRS